MFPCILKHNPFRLATLGGIGQGRRFLRRIVPGEPLPGSQRNYAFSFDFYSGKEEEFSACKFF
jgi:hypothetical protein